MTPSCPEWSSQEGPRGEQDVGAVPGEPSLLVSLLREGIKSPGIKTELAVTE